MLTHGRESWVMTERVRSQMKVSEMRFLGKIKGVTTRESLNIELLLLRIERSQLR